MEKFNYERTKTGQPKIEIKKDGAALFLELIGWIFVAGMIFIPLYYMNELPDEIPVHFKFSGEIDGFGDKSVLWVLSGIGVFTYVLLFVINRYPHKFNYLVRITKDNAEIQYRMATRLIRKMNLLVAAMIFFVEFEIVNYSLTERPFPFTGMVYFFLVLLLIMIAKYFFRSNRYK